MAERLTRAEKQAQTRQRLLDAAVEAVREHGFHATSLEDIARAAGLTKGAVYSNFASKEELVSEVAEVLLAGMTRVPEGETLGEFLQSLGDSLVDMAESERQQIMLTLEFVAYVMRNPHLLERIRRDFAESRSRDTFADWQEELGGLSPEEFGIAVDIVSTGLLIYRLLYGEKAVSPALVAWLLARLAEG